MKSNMRKKSLISGSIAVFLLSFALLIPAVQANAAEGIAINETNFPDANFREYVLTKIDTDDDEVLSDAEITATTSISVSGMSISDMTGIEHFTEIRSLSCGENPIQSLDLSNNKKLLDIWCSNSGQLEYLVVKSPVVKYIYAQNCQLISMDISECIALEYLWCPTNKLTALDVSNNTELETLICAESQIRELDVSNNLKLTALGCDENLLTVLDVSNNKELTELYCGYNKLTVLDISNNTELEWLDCEYNQLTSLDISKHSKLKDLRCGGNQITSLDFSNNPALEEIQCEGNPIIFLDFSKCLNVTRCYTEGNVRTLCGKNGIDLSKIPGFDATKVSNLNGATYDAKSNKFVGIIADEISYRYDCGHGITKEFRILVAHVDEDDDGKCEQCGTFTKIKVDKDNFPDDIFRSYVLEEIDNNKNKVLDSEEIEEVYELDLDEKGIADLKGIEYFENLQQLSCNKNKLTSLDISKCFELRFLYCERNQLTDLDVRNNTNLVQLDCEWNQIADLDVSKNKELDYLECSGNELTVLDVTKNTKLEYLLCTQNKLTSLDVSKNTELIMLQCSWNQITDLDVSKNIHLMNMGCVENPLKTLDLSNNTELVNLQASECKLTSLNLANNTAIKYFDVDDCVYEIPHAARFLLSNLPNFDASKASDWTGATYNSADNTLTGFGDSTKVTYNYDCGNGYVFKGTLVLTHIDENKDLKCDGCGYILGYEINETNFPDPVFREYIATNVDKDNDKIINEAERSVVKSISVGYNGSIADLKGIEYFENLSSLDCQYNQLTTLDVSKNTALTSLACFGNKLTNLDISKNIKLTWLTCDSNQLTSLDVSKNTKLVMLRCGGNQLTELDLSNNLELENLICERNKLTVLDLSNNPKINHIVCNSNQLTYLNVSNAVELKELVCYANKLTNLDVSKSTKLEELNCWRNQLKSLDVSKNVTLAVLRCNSNQIKSLDVSKNTELTALYCDMNPITALDLSNNTKIQTFSMANCELAIPESESFSLSSLPGFVASKASDWTGATYNSADKTLTGFNAKTKITYNYDCGNGFIFKGVIAPQHIDENKDGKCEFCVGSSDDKGSQTENSAVKLDKEEIKITVDNYMELDESVINDADAYMQITRPNGEKIEIKVNEAPVKEREDGTKEFVFSVDFAAKEMADKVKAQIVSGDGSVGTEYTYSMTDYADAILEDTTGKYEEEKPLVKSMLNYGAMAQKYFEHNTDNLANKKLDEADRVIEEAPDLSEHSYKAEPGELQGISYKGTALVLKAEFGIKHFFDFEESVDISKLSFTVNGETVYPELSHLGWHIDIEGISIYDLDKEFELKISDADGNEYGLSYSVLSYADAVLKKDSSEVSSNLKNLVNSIYSFHEAAKSYSAVQ